MDVLAEPTVCLHVGFTDMYFTVIVPNCREGVCADPGKRDATLGAGGPGPPGKGDEQQLVPDSGGGET